MFTPSVNVVQSAFPENPQGEISGLSRSVSDLGSSFGTAIAGTILVADLADPSRSYGIAMIVLAFLGLIGLGATNLLPAAEPCPCRKLHPCSSCRMLVLMKHSTEPVASSDVKAGDLARAHERHGQWLERPGVGDALMRPVPVAGLLELPEGVQKAGLVPDQRAVQ